MTDITQYNWITVANQEWGIHLWGELEEYDDGTAQVVDIDARILPPTGGEFNYNADNWSKFPEEVCNLADALLDDHKTSDNMLETWGDPRYVGRTSLSLITDQRSV
jgi:hypothetical protein